MSFGNIRLVVIYILINKKNSNAKKTRYPVASYRTHTNNILNMKKNIDLDELKEK